MAKKILWTEIRVPEYPRVRFFLKDSSLRGKLKDVTNDVCKLVIEDLEDDSGFCELLRLNPEGKLVWKTKHQSLQETKWQVQFEYGVPDEKWLKFSE